jgi:AraC-like DNA-binding protein
VIHRQPRRELAPFVSRLWCTIGATAATATRELVLPSGAMHVVIRLDQPLRVFDSIAAADARTVGYAIVGGARSTAYVRDISQPTASVGAQLRPGASALLLGVPASALSERHTSLDDVWGSFAALVRERLLEIADPNRRLDLFEAALVSRLPRIRGIHPAVAHALERFAATDDVASVVKDIGYSHRRFIALFRDAVGLTPKLYCRVGRLQRVLRLLGDRRSSLADAAFEAGYSDQPHLNRELRDLVGVSPGEYRMLAPELSNHVPLKKTR